MKFKTAGRSKAIWICIAAAVVLIPGCAGPSTEILPHKPGSVAPAEPEAKTLRLKPANAFYLRESVEYLTRTPRVSGSPKEEQAVRYMQRQLTSYGYEAELQTFPLAADDSQEVLPQYGMNLIATREADAADSDILIISTRHDTAIDSPGAVKSGAGVAVWLECARLLSDIPTDTQIRFVSFSGSEEGYAGSQAYVQTLKPEERYRIIGVIQLDQLGDRNQEDMILGSIDGGPVMVGDMLLEAAQVSGREQWSYQKQTDSDIVSFIRSQVPAVSVSQRWESYLNQLPQDRMENVDVDQLVPVTETVAAAAARMMSSETPSLMAKSHFTNNLSDRIYVQEPQQVLPFGETPDRLLALTGLESNLVVSNTDDTGVRLDTYQYPMKWFRADQIIMTSFYYHDGKLETITLDAAGAGVTFDEMRGWLTSCYGEPGGINQGLYGTEYDWTDPIGRAYFALIPTGTGFTVDIGELQTGRMELIQYLPDGTPKEQTAGDGRRYEGLFELTAAVFGTDLEQAAYVDIYTDGIGATQGYLDFSKIGDTDADAMFVIGIDGEEALLPDGSFKDYPKTAAMLIEYYGQVLEQTKQKGSAAAFYEAFSGTGQSSDFAADFCLFVISRRPEQVIHESDKKILFFYDYEDLAGLRDQIRGQLQLTDGS